MPGAITLLPTIWDWESVSHVLHELDANPDATDALQQRIADWFSGCVSDGSDGGAPVPGAAMAMRERTRLAAAHAPIDRSVGLHARAPASRFFF